MPPAVPVAGRLERQAKPLGGQAANDARPRHRTGGVRSREGAEPADRRPLQVARGEPARRARAKTIPGLGPGADPTSSGSSAARDQRRGAGIVRGTRGARLAPLAPGNGGPVRPRVASDSSSRGHGVRWRSTCLGGPPRLDQQGAPACARRGPRRRRVRGPGQRRWWRSREPCCGRARRGSRRGSSGGGQGDTTGRLRQATIGCLGGPRSKHSSLSRHDLIERSYED